MLSDEIDYTLIPYDRRSATETILAHAGVVVAAPIFVWVTATHVSGVSVQLGLVAAVFAILAINAGVAVTLAVTSYRKHLSSTRRQIAGTLRQSRLPLWQQ